MAVIETIEENSVEELKDWLFQRVADPNDIVVDEMQEEFAETWDKREESKDLTVGGTQEYKDNINASETSIALIQKPANKDALVGPLNKKLNDGLRLCWYRGGKDKWDRPHGNGILKYENNDVFTGEFFEGILNRKGELKKCSEGRAISGVWKNGLLEGEIRDEGQLGDWIEGYYKNGVPHGFQREFGIKDSCGNYTLRFLGRYFRGVARGFCWKGLMGQGFMCGKVDENGEFTGNDIAYIYPDFKNVLYGEFKQGLLVKAQLCHLNGCTFEEGMAIPTFSAPIEKDVFYEYETPSRLCISKNPLIRDPWENSRVYVDQSKLPQGGQGLFSKIDIKKHEIICFYNGIRMKTASFAAQNADHSDYRIRLNADIDLDIPNEFISLEKYCATLGHKVNHSNVPNAEWSHVEHPRFGLVRGLSAQRDIQKGEEILINYHINLGDAPMWYKKVWLQHQKNVKNKSNESIQRLLDRYYDDTGKRVEIELDDEEFVVPEPKGITNHHEFDDDDDDEINTNQESELEKAKKLLRIKSSPQTVEDSEPRIEEIS